MTVTNQPVAEFLECRQVMVARFDAHLVGASLVSQPIAKVSRLDISPTHEFAAKKNFLHATTRLVDMLLGVGPRFQVSTEAIHMYLECSFLALLE